MKIWDFSTRWAPTMVINGVQTHINGLGLVGKWGFFHPCKWSYNRVLTAGRGPPSRVQPLQNPPETLMIWLHCKVSRFGVGRDIGIGLAHDSFGMKGYPLVFPKTKCSWVAYVPQQDALRCHTKDNEENMIQLNKPRTRTNGTLRRSFRPSVTLELFQLTWKTSSC